jgi:hypothetical protein
MRGRLSFLPGGDLIGRWKQSMKFVATTNYEKSAEVIVPAVNVQTGKDRTL